MDNLQNKTKKRERFKRLAVYRTNEVLKRLKVLGNCANRSAYNYNEEDINKIFSEMVRIAKEKAARKGKKYILAKCYQII